MNLVEDGLVEDSVDDGVDVVEETVEADCAVAPVVALDWIPLELSGNDELAGT